MWETALISSLCVCPGSLLAVLQPIFSRGLPQFEWIWELQTLGLLPGLVIFACDLLLKSWELTGLGLLSNPAFVSRWGGPAMAQFPQSCIRFVVPNCWEVLQCSHVRKDLGVHQTKGQRVLSTCDVHNCCYSAVHTRSLGKGLSEWNLPLNRNCLKSPHGWLGLSLAIPARGLCL